ncbi:MAG: hypothetical protein H0X25_23055 [Acidobacteriales bacterium]|nr:hypothetical protein [Terriglobales bacterium]
MPLITLAQLLPNDLGLLSRHLDLNYSEAGIHPQSPLPILTFQLEAACLLLGVAYLDFLDT